MPELASLIDEKWKRFGLYHHLMHAIVPYAVLTAALTASILLRIRSLSGAQFSCFTGTQVQILTLHAECGVHQPCVEVFFKTIWELAGRCKRRCSSNTTP